MTGLLSPGSVLHDRYRIEELVGAGGGGAVYRAADLRLAGRFTAVKEIRPDAAASAALRADAREQFRREATTLARLDHPALPKVSDYFDVDDTDYLVMDFVAGPDLRQVAAEARSNGVFLPEERVLDWMLQLLDAVAYLHDQDPIVLHRDIKPANIKLMERDRIKLVDFGLVKPLDPTDPRTLTMARGIGSLPYTPLEQYAGDTGHTDPRSDLYGVGATLYHLLTGMMPATAQERFLSPAALVRPRRLNPELSALVEGAILAAMALHPDRRPAGARQLADQLRGRAPLPRVGADVVLPEGQPAPRGSGRWSSGLAENGGLLALVAFLLVLAVLATWQSQHGAREPATAVNGTATAVSGSRSGEPGP